MSKGHYRPFKKKPKELVVTAISPICNELSKRGYIELTKGYNNGKNFKSASIIKPTEKLLNMMPPDLSYRIRREGLIIPKEFTPPSVYPEDVQDAENVLYEYNQMVEPWNMLYASYKGGFDINGRFTGSEVIFMKKEARKRLKMGTEDTFEIDVTGCLPSILYANELQIRLSDDVYDIDEAPRKIAKTAFVIMLNAKSEYSAKWAIQGMINDKHRAQYRATPIMKALSKKHYALRDWFYSGIGCKLMNMEAGCMRQFLKEMIYEGVKVYPVYDCAVAKMSDREIVESSFRRAFTINGIELPVH